MLKVNSKQIETGDTFLALKSVIRDGHDYIEEAIDRGAACIIAERGDYNVKTIIVEDTRKYLANYLQDLYQDKLKKLKKIGITGTNGKTTSCYLIYQLLNKLNIKTAYIGTIGFYTPNNHKPLVNTTPDLYDLYNMMVEAVDEGCEVIAIEVSSQALDMRRLEGIKFDIAAFTNLTNDHLDYHKTMLEYMQAKQKLFQNVNEYTIINIDDKYSNNFILDKNINILFGQKKSNYEISNIRLTDKNSTFTITSENIKTDITLPLLGKHNIYNYMYAYIICDKLKLNMNEVIIQTLNLRAPRGRYQMLTNKKFSVIIDYAHTPDAVQNIIESVNQYASNKLVTLIGCGGDRDKSKRPIMGQIATYFSDYVFFTSDNPRTEDPNEIIKDMTQTLDKDNYEIIVDRKEAIKKAINSLEENDILLVLGKGHENYQIIGKEKIPFSDYEEIKKYVK